MDRRTWKTLSRAAAALATALAAPAAAQAGTFDEIGTFSFEPDAISSVDFEIEPGTWFPPDAPEPCQTILHELVSAPDALEGQSYARVDLPPDCTDRIPIPLPALAGSYRARVWLRHGAPTPFFTVRYPEASGRGTLSAVLGPTGRTTSDGWVEYASNELPVDGFHAEVAYLVVSDTGAGDGVDVDALEVELAGDYEAPKSCEGLFDPTCQGEHRCVDGACLLGRLAVPPMPPEAIRGEMIDALESRLRVFFGGRRTRLENLPVALGSLETMRDAQTAFQFWDAFGRGVRELRDWHTYSRAAGGFPRSSGRVLNVCFIEGDADLSHDVAPSDPQYPDLLVSHVGPAGTKGLHRGDRLVAVDGQHPIAWMRSLLAYDWGHHTASDPSVFADYAEDLGGRRNSGGAKIALFAKTFSVVRCDAQAGTCADTVETLSVKDLETDAGGFVVACDNRPVYSLEDGKNPGESHSVGGQFFTGRVAATTEEEAIHGMIFDTLYGGGDPNGWVNSNISNAIDFWKQNARGVIVDHRAGNGGTLDAVTNFTRLVRPPASPAVVRMPMASAGFDGPDTPEEGIALYQASLPYTPLQVGAVDWAQTLPVAFIQHRDGSASDFLPYGLRGSPKTKLFGPHATVGAFSTFFELSLAGGIGFQLASGDTISSDGEALIGHGVAPDFVVQQKQSDLLQGKDTLFEAALAWVRSELPPVP